MTAADVVRLIRDEDCPACGFPETYAEVIPDAAVPGAEAFGCSRCGWRSKDDELVVLAGRLALVREQVAQLREMDADLTADIAARMSGQQTTAGRWRLERHKGAKRNAWDSAGLFDALIRRANYDAETGEARTDAAARDHLIGLVRDCVPLTSSLGWRAGALRDHGLDPDDWCTKTPGPWRVDVVLDAEADSTTSEA